MAKISQKDTIKGLAVWWVILIIVVIIVVSVVTISFIFPRPGSEPWKFGFQDVPVDTSPQKIYNKPVVDYEKKPAYALAGTIKRISESQMVVSVSDSEPNPFLAGRDFTVNVDEKTKFALIKASFGVSILEDEKGATLEIKPRNLTLDTKEQSAEPIEFNAFLVEDYVAILAHEEIKQKDIFIAKEIYKLQ